MFSDPKRIDRRCDIDSITAFNDIPGGGEHYLELMRKTWRQFEEEVYHQLVRITWLIKRFTYNGKRRSGLNQNGIYIDQAFGIYMRHYVGFDNRILFSGYSSLSKVATYIEELIPNFDLFNPFEQEYQFPYQYMNLACLALIYQMPERLDLLAYGEKKRMSYTEFQDYILNYINCYNDEHGETYVYIFPRSSMPYIKYLKV